MPDSSFETYSKMMISKVPKGKEFVLSTGESIDDLYSLRTALRNMDQSVFEHHVNDSKNDFAEWVRHVVKDTELYGSLKGTRSKRKAYDIVNRRVKELTMPAKKTTKKSTRKTAKKSAGKAVRNTSKKTAKTARKKSVNAASKKKTKSSSKKSGAKAKRTAAQKKVKTREHVFSKRGVPYHKKDFNGQRSRPPKEHEYLRGGHEHVHFNFREFMYGLIFGIAITLIVLRILALI